MMTTSSEQRLGLACALSAFSLWGVVPMFFKLLATVEPLLVIAHRIIWSLLLLGLFLLLRDRGRLPQTLAIGRPAVLRLMVSGALVACNWLVFVWAVGHNQIMDTALGYFINPLVNVLLGVLVLGERLRTSGWWAVTLAAAGTVYLGIDLGQPPWIALTLAISFGCYGLVRKMLAVGPLVGLFWECLWLTPLALTYLLLQPAGSDFFGTAADPQKLWLVLSGVVTLVPLALFAAATRRLTLTAVGFTQYLAPSISLGLAVYVYDEVFTAGHRVAFGCIWSALAIYTLAPIVGRWRRGRQAVARIAVEEE